MEINKENYSAYFIKNMRSKLVILDKKRQGALIVFTVLILAWFIFAAYLYKKFDMEVEIAIKTLGVATSLLVWTFFKISSRDYVKNYKDKIIQLTFGFILKDMVYLKNNKLSEGDYENSMLFQGNYNRYEGEDYVSGIFKSAPLQMSELAVIKRVSNGKRKYNVIIFKGLMAMIDIPHSFSKETCVTPESLDRLISNPISRLFSKNKNIDHHDEVRLESDDFEKLFHVSSSDQIESRRILTPHIQETLTKLAKTNGLKFAFSIRPGKIYVAFPSQKNFFEPPFFTSCVETKSTREIVSLFLFIDELLNVIRNND